MNDTTQETQQECPHGYCGCHQHQIRTFSTLSLGESIAKFCNAILRLIKLIGPFINTYFVSKKVSYVLAVDKKTAVWKPPLIKDTMDKTIQFYKRHGITLTYTMEERTDIRTVKTEQRLSTSEGKNTIFLVDDFSNCANCTLKGYEFSKNVVVRYYEQNRKPSPFLWTTVAHELGHAFLGDNKHGGTLANLMNEMGPESEVIKDVDLTICQVVKMKQNL